MNYHSSLCYPYLQSPVAFQSGSSVPAACMHFTSLSSRLKKVAQGESSLVCVLSCRTTPRTSVWFLRAVAWWISWLSWQKSLQAGSSGSFWVGRSLEEDLSCAARIMDHVLWEKRKHPLTVLTRKIYRWRNFFSLLGKYVVVKKSDKTGLTPAFVIVESSNHSVVCAIPGLGAEVTTPSLKVC